MMETFIVSARKYRPSSFDSVIGQAAITTTLKNAILNKHLAQAFLFCGPRGVGKTTCARILAKAVNCENLGDSVNPCDTCSSCVSFNTSHSFNIHELDGASNNKVEDIKSLIEQIRIAPSAGKYKVYIIDEVHMLSQNAFNAFLKTLEEPPSYAIFILATTEKHKIIPTILSRCQIYDFHRIQVDAIAAHLTFVAEKEGVNAETEALHIIAQKADGSLRDALSIFDQLVSFSGNTLTYKSVIDNLNILDYEYYFNLTDSLLSSDLSAILLIFHDILQNGFDIRNFITGLSKHFRDLLVIKDQNIATLLDVSPVLRNRYLEQSSRTTAGWLLKALNLTNQCDYQYPVSSNQRLLTEIMLMNIADSKTDGASSPASGIKNSSSETSPGKTTATLKKNEIPVAEPEVQKPTGIRTYASPISDQKPSTFSDSPPAPYSEKSKVISIAGLNKENLTSPRPPLVVSVVELNGGEIPASPRLVGAGGASATPVTASANSGFTGENLQKAWKELVERANQKGRKSLFTSLSKRYPEKISETLIEYMADYKIQLDEITIEKTAIVDFLKNRLKCAKLQLNLSLNPEPVQQGPMSLQERYKKMAELNPNLDRFREQLNLEIEL